MLQPGKGESKIEFNNITTLVLDSTPQKIINISSEYEAKVTDVEQKDVQTGAYFTEPTEKTRKIHEKLIQMCMADIDNKTRKFAANNPQVTLQEGMKISFNSQPAAPGLRRCFFTICKTN